MSAVSIVDPVTNKEYNAANPMPVNIGAAATSIPDSAHAQSRLNTYANATNLNYNMNANQANGFVPVEFPSFLAGV